MRELTQGTRELDEGRALAPSTADEARRARASEGRQA